MTALVTIGPTQEPLDAMRLISNRSTGELGTLLAATLAGQGHRVIALRGTGSTASPESLDHGLIRIVPFTTTENLRRELENLAPGEQVDAIFHAAAVSDFYLPGAGVGKIPTKQGALTLTLEPTPKLLPLLRGWFPSARIVGWKFEASGNCEDVIAVGSRQIASCHTDACVLNGPSYGPGFGILSASGEISHVEDRKALCARLSEELSSGSR
jgi:phosphopantothenoylcysteine decarboxylase/phosphopantothenate--cysteine ligase